MKLTYYTDVKEGKFQKNITELIRKELPHFNGKRVEISIQRLKSSRSSQQNRYYWLLVGIMSKELGYTKDEVHDLIKFKFLKQEVVIGEETEIVVKSTTKLNKTEFGDFIDELQTWASGLGIYLPDAGEQVPIEF